MKFPLMNRTTASIFRVRFSAHQRLQMRFLQECGKSVGMYDVTIVFTDDQNAILVVYKLTWHPAHVFKAAIQCPHQVFGRERLFLKDTPFKPGIAQGKRRHI